MARPKTRMKNKFERINNIGSDAVQAKTGKSWAEWIAILDKAGAGKMTHQQIVAHLHTQNKVGAWWQQMLTVGYEQARGKRAVHQKPEGFQIGASKTVDAPVSQVYALWSDKKARAQFLPAKSISVSKATRNKSIRATWKDRTSRVDFNFYAKGKTKSQVTIQHGKLANAREANRMKVFWARVLEKFAQSIQD